MKFSQMLLGAVFCLGSSTAFAEALQKLSIQGMMCTSCSGKVEKAFLETGKVASIKVNAKDGTALVEWKDGQALSATDVEKIVKDAGFELKSAS